MIVVAIVSESGSRAKRGKREQRHNRSASKNNFRADLMVLSLNVELSLFS